MKLTQYFIISPSAAAILLLVIAGCGKPNPKAPTSLQNTPLAKYNLQDIVDDETIVLVDESTYRTDVFMLMADVDVDKAALRRWSQAHNVELTRVSGYSAIERLVEVFPSLSDSEVSAGSGEYFEISADRGVLGGVIVDSGSTLALRYLRTRDVGGN